MDRETVENDLCTIIQAGDSYGQGQSPTDALSLTVEDSLRWEAGDTITIKLLGGSKRVKSLVEYYARLWLNHANLEMDFVSTGRADVRVSFYPGGSYSVVGINCRCVMPQDKPTMNLAIDDATPEHKFRRCVLHEFGHVLGFIHEHQNPAGNIQWDVNEVYNHYLHNQNRSVEWVDRKIFEAYSYDSHTGTEFDKDSVMIYPILAKHTTNGFSVGMNTQLSQKDKEYAATVYPPADAPTPIQYTNPNSYTPIHYPDQDVYVYPDQSHSRQHTYPLHRDYNSSAALGSHYY
ncbi:hypothetical protein QBC44DRAFT_301560 [Cladorrhinum sp. PSN332]|nr:hypothetical protein QBC44DRAFT_301560 [Cladorrhinum sp. PSN332]